jgi:hypothetical protein
VTTGPTAHWAGRSWPINTKRSNRVVHLAVVTCLVSSLPVSVGCVAKMLPISIPKCQEHLAVEQICTSPWPRSTVLGKCIRQFCSCLFSASETQWGYTCTIVGKVVLQHDLVLKFIFLKVFFNFEKIL